jgi:hypothetical protein
MECQTDLLVLKSGAAQTLSMQPARMERIPRNNSFLSVTCMFFVSSFTHSSKYTTMHPLELRRPTKAIEYG